MYTFVFSCEGYRVNYTSQVSHTCLCCSYALNSDIINAKHAGSSVTDVVESEIIPTIRLYRLLADFPEFCSLCVNKDKQSNVVTHHKSACYITVVTSTY